MWKWHSKKFTVVIIWQRSNNRSMIPKPSSPLCCPGFYLYILGLLSYRSMSSCLESQPLGIITAFCWQMIHRSPELSIPTSFQSWTSLPYSKIYKKLLWRIECKLLSLTLNNHDNLTQSISLFQLYLLFVDSHLVVALRKYSSYSPHHQLFIPSELMLLFPQVLWWEGIRWSLSLLFISAVNLPGMWLYCVLVSKFSWKISSQ